MSACKGLKVWHTNQVLTGRIALPASKSESNRALIIQALTKGKARLENLSEANDTRLLQQLLNSPDTELNAEDAGTTFRFLTAYLAITNQQKTLTGTARMQQRPIGLLVDALRELGADIEYMNKEGYPPLQLNGIDLSWPAQEISVPGHVSSQFISALLLIAPYLPQGLRVHVTGHIASRPYLDLTLALMQHFGAKSYWEGETIVTEPVPYEPKTYTISADWSCAGYWFSLVALSQNAEIYLPGLSPNKLQADFAVVEICRIWGVHTEFTKNGAKLRKIQATLPGRFAYDFSGCPDLAPTIMVLAALTGVVVSATGLQSLRIKETDRIAALQNELRKIGANLEELDGQWQLNPGVLKPDFPVEINTYSDHRMALAFAAAGLLFPVIIETPEVVRKSYPGFWKDLETAGFSVQETTLAASDER